MQGRPERPPRHAAGGGLAPEKGNRHVQEHHDKPHEAEQHECAESIGYYFDEDIHSEMLLISTLQIYAKELNHAVV